MLQQTQVSRVLVKYQEFLNAFPTFLKLSKSTLREVLGVWQGMGYNRRAKYLLESAKIVVKKYAGRLPQEPEYLDSLPGIGCATASSISAFAFNMPTVFIETNIRRVFIHHFFKDRDDIDDAELMPLITKSLDTKNPREWYWALMDYGSFLAKTVENPNKKSRHYLKQSAFATSDRRIRGIILKQALTGLLTVNILSDSLNESPERIVKIINALVSEGFLVKKKDVYHIV